MREKQVYSNHGKACIQLSLKGMDSNHERQVFCNHDTWIQ
jgi:hypothetical protein